MIKKTSKKVVICGGHHNSALVVAEALREKGYQVFWLGHKYSMIGDKNPSAEYLEVTKKEFPFVEIKAGKFQPRYQFFHYLLRIPLGFWQSFTSLQRIKPDLIFSFGGYLALPVAYAGFLLGIPVVTHEQTAISGWANKMIARVAKKVFVTHETSSKYFPQEKVVVTGLPIREEVLKKGKKLFQNGKKTIYVTGGKQGAHVVNEAIFAILPELLEKFNVIHQCGSTSVFNDIKKAKGLKERLGDKGKYYWPKEYFFEEEIGSVFSSADLVISRAGAHTVYELLALKKPSILIPIPWASGNEQEENAKVLVNAGLGEILPQKELEAGKLWGAILEFEKNLSSKSTIPPSPKIEADATPKIVSEIEKLMTLL
jgi:UDP-N-acetylglucosamine--N-acetylmuramyl-(pentapeptide) pyrophosphoryl-undecaprenol N-acetylglucosamine transferase